MRKIYNWYTDVRDKVYTHTRTCNMMRGRTHTCQGQINFGPNSVVSVIHQFRVKGIGYTGQVAQRHCAQLIAIVFNVQSSQPSVTLDVVAPSVSAIVALVIRAYKTVLNGIKG